MSIGVAFTVLIAAFGAALITYNFEQNKSLALTTSSELFQQMMLETAGHVGKIYAPVETIVDLTVKIAPAKPGSLPERLASLGYFTEALRNNPQLSALYIGYGTGDFFLVRSVAGAEVGSGHFAVPAGTAFVVQSIERGEAGAVSYDTLYYDSDLRHIGSQDKFVTGYDPRARDWYQQAIRTEGLISTDFYVFFTTGEAGTTIARQFAGGDAVVGADLTLEAVSAGLQSHSITPSTEIVVFAADGTVLGYRDSSRLGQVGDGSMRAARKPYIDDIGEPVLDELFRRFVDGNREQRLAFDVGGVEWLSWTTSVAFGPDRKDSVFMAILVPEHELLKDLEWVRLQSALISLVGLIFAVMLAWWLSKCIADPARELAHEANQIRQLRLKSPITVRSSIVEIDDLSRTMAVMKEAIQRFAGVATALSVEQSSDNLYELILRETSAACDANYAAVLMMSDDGRYLQRTSELHGGNEGEIDRQAANSDAQRIALLDSGGVARDRCVEAHSALSAATVVVADTATDSRFDLTDNHCRSMLLVPLKTAEGSVIGLLQLGKSGTRSRRAGAGFTKEIVAYIEALTSNAAVALDNQRLMDAYHDMFEALIRIIAVAIDAKSPYTAGHCQRVPMLTGMLAEAASESDQSAFKDFELTQAIERELYVASWLHDCGKVTTPEHVVDKATKLETVHNRIHEVRMRFEVLWRDAEIAYYRTLIDQPDSARDAQRQLETEQARIRDDFEFIAECNIGSESMTPERVDRVRSIAGKMWVRHLDDTLGLSSEEFERRKRNPADQTPAVECLLADKAEHLVEHNDVGERWGDNPYGFCMPVPEHEYNFGEIHNLTVNRGTLTPEERFKVNDHIIQTLIMLNSVPFPRELQRVPDLAGNHHEKLDGTGFPRRLTGAQMSVEERIMAIADIFEALTAADRPYKKAKTLSESIRIMSGMRDNGHICPDLFDLFLNARVYARYADKFLDSEQIDAADFSHYTRSGNGVLKRNVG